ncbi:MAG TPA: hypothetical protein VMV79_03905 [Alphaproteobacteria bacterium]|nr:hypothetical protein [Alphaproteobacteria bacterium]
MLAFGLLPLTAAPLPRLFKAYLAFNAYCCINYFVAWFFIRGVADPLYFNQLVFLPIGVLLLRSKIEEPLVKLMDFMFVLLLLQIVLSAALALSGHDLWNDGAFVGGMGNANDFGIALMLGLVYVWTIRPTDRWTTALSCLLVLAGFLTESLLILLIAFSIPALTGFLELGSSKRLVLREIQVSALLGAFLGAGYAIRGSLPHLGRKIAAVLGYAGILSDVTPTGSIYGRVDQFDYAWNAERHASLLKLWLVGHPTANVYRPFDSQFLCYAFNFGALMALAFCLFSVLFLIKAYRAEKRWRAFLVTGLAIFNIAFFSNHLLDYFPMGLLYITLIAATLRHQEPPDRPPTRISA